MEQQRRQVQPQHDEFDPVLADTLPQDDESQKLARELSSRDSLPPATVPGYTILRSLGEGAYGAVWLAREQNTGRLVAVKFYSHRRGLDWSLLNREVEKLAVLYTSRNIVGLIDVGWESDPPYYIMEFLENGSLANLLASGPLPVSEAVRIAKSVLQALIHAHGAGILHCDLKPANVLLDRDYEPRLCDFGQSRLTHEQKPALGTLFYMAPEQADLKAVPDARWDVYALGALLYHMICGGCPHRTPENEDRIRQTDQLEERLAEYRRIFEHSPRPSEHRRVRGVDRALADIIDRCLSRDVDRRFANAQAVLDAITRYEHRRARRPLIVLGIVGPALLLCGMAVVVGNLMRNAVVTARANMTQRALESDALPARILARTVEQDLETELSELVQIAADPRLRNLMPLADEPHDARAPLVEFLDEKKAASQQHLPVYEQDTSWFLTDAEGVQRWRSPWKLTTIDRLFAYRDYFHGQNLQFEDVQIHTEPIRAPHISTPFRSQATGRYMVAISVPVWDAQHESVLGILARTKELGKFQTQFGRGMLSPGEENARIIALVDRRAGWQLIDHPWMTPENMKQHPRAAGALTLHPRLVARLEAAYGDAEGSGGPPDVRIEDYVDPICAVSPQAASDYGGVWLAAISPIANTTWMAVVQEPRERAWEPVEEMKSGLIEYGAWALAICFGFIMVLWVLVIRALRERAFRIRPRPDHARGTGPPSTISLS